MKINEEGGVILVDKPVTWSSFDVVKKLRYNLKIKKIGHAGTLDPLATGLLVIGYGKFTKKLNEYQGLEKVYTGIIEIGKTTPTYDLESEFDSQSSIENVNEDLVEKVRQQYLGNITQYPPIHSAVKVDGKRAYQLARENKPVEVKSREVVIHEFEITKISFPELYFKIKCSKGTYIRSLAHDFGKALGVGGYLKLLRREKIGDFSVADANTPEEIIAQFKEVSSEDS